MICPRAFSTTIRISIGPGSAENVTLAPAAGGADAADGAVDPDVADASVAASGVAAPTGPRNTGRPSEAIAVSITRAGVSLARAVAAAGSGSQTNMTRDLPSAPRSVPVQKRAACPPETGSTIEF